MRLFWIASIVSVLGLNTPVTAGIKWVEIGVNGLTCSMCSRSVEMSLLKLDFVEDVEMKLETAEGKISINTNSPVNLNAIAKAIVNAGFSVRFVKLQMSFEDIALQKDGTFVFQGQIFEWIDYTEQTRESVSLQLLEENFLPKKESAAWKKRFVNSKSGEKIFHVVQG